MCVVKARLLNVLKLLQVVHFNNVPLPLFGVSLLTVATGSVLTTGRLGDTVPESASVSPFDDITLPVRGLPAYHSPASKALA